MSATVAELADARDLKSRESKISCGFDPLPWHFVLIFMPKYSAIIRFNQEGLKNIIVASAKRQKVV